MRFRNFAKSFFSRENEEVNRTLHIKERGHEDFHIELFLLFQIILSRPFPSLIMEAF